MRSGKFGFLGSFSSSRLWTPLDLAVPPKILMDDQSLVTDASGAASVWADRSGNDFDFSNGTPTKRPAILASGLAGKRVLRFDGADDRLVHDGAGSDVFRNTSSGWLFSIYKKRSSAAPSNGASIFYCAAGALGSQNNRFNSISLRAGQIYGGLASRRQLTDTVVVITKSSPDIGDWVARLDIADWANGSLYMWANGELDVSNTTSMTPGVTSDTDVPGLIIGAAGVATSELANSYSDIDVAAVVVGSGSLPSAAEIDKLFGSYMWHFGIEANLPIGHPYKDAPPMVG